MSSYSVDERVVAMKFDNKDFEKNSAETMSTLEKLKAKLNFSDMQNGLNSVDTSKLNKELGKIGDFDSSKLDSVLDKIEYRMSSMGIFTARIVENVADDIYNIMKKAFDAVDKVVTYAEQGIVQGGYKRASNIESAKFQLEGLGIAWKDIYSDIDYAVTNTAYSLDQAAIVASRLASSGIKPGETWVDYTGATQDIDTMAMILRSISGTAAATGGKADYADIGNIFTKMLSYGKVYTSQLNELGTYGIGAKGIVAEYLNQIKYQGSSSWTEQKVTEKMSDKKNGGLDPMIVLEAMYQKFGEHATAANTTLSGVMANTKSALARIGEKFFTPIIENGGPLVKLFEALRQSINDVNKAIGPVVELLGKDVSRALDSVASYFVDTEVDEEGNKTWKLKKAGGILSDFFEPWKEGEWIKTDIPNADHIPTALPTEYYQEYETRAQKIAQNLRETFLNIIGIVKGFGKIVGAAFSAASGTSVSFAAILVNITGLLAKVTGMLKAFLNPTTDLTSNGLYLFLRAIFSGIDIVVQFGKSFKKHILDPIFSAGKEVAKASGVGDWFKDLFKRIYDFDQMLKQEGNEDYFGPFLEKVKEGFKNIKDAVSNGISYIIDWWKPVKDILFDTDLGFGDKIEAIKSYFSENFELPGWSKAKDIFSGVGDAINKAWTAIKNFFGFGSKSTKQLTDSASSLSDEYETVAEQINFYDRGIISKDDSWFGASFSSMITSADTSTDKLSGIGEKLSSFFESIKESFSNINVEVLQGVSLGVLAAIILLGAGIVWAVTKIVKGLKKVIIDFPTAVNKVLDSFNGVLVQIGGMFKAQKVEAYSSALKNIAIATAVLTGVFMGLAAILAIVDHFGGGDAMAAAMHKAGLTIAQIGADLALMLASIIFVTNVTGGGGYAASFAAGKGLSLSAPGAGLSAVSELIKSFVLGITVLAGVMVVLGALSYTGLLDRGMKELLKIVELLGGVVIGIVGVVGIMTFINALNIDGLLKSSNGAFAGGLAAIAGIILSLVAAIAILIPAIVVLGALSYLGIFQEGLNALWGITGWLLTTVGLIMLVTAITTKINSLNAKQVALSILSMAALVGAISVGILEMSIAMAIISRLNGGQWAAAMGSFVMMTAMLIGIPALLMLIYKKLEMVKSTKFVNNPLTSMTLMVLAIGASVLIMSKGIAELAGVDPGNMILAMVGIMGIFGVMAGVIYNLSRFNAKGLKQAAITMGVMGGVIVALNVMLIILSRNLNKSMIIAGAIMLGEILVLAAAIWGLSKFLERFGKGAKYDSLVNFAISMGVIAAALIPISAAMFVIIKALDGFNGSGWDIGAATLGMIGALAAVMLLATYMTNNVGKNITDKNIKSLLTVVITLSAAMAVLGGVIAGLVVALGYTDLTTVGAVGVIAGFALVMYAFSVGVSKIVDSLSKIQNAKGAIVPGIVAMMSIILPMAAFAAAIGILSQFPVDRIIASGVVLAALTVGALFLTKFIISFSKSQRWSTNYIKKIAVTIGTYAAISLATIPLGIALAKVAKIGRNEIYKAGLVLTVMGAVMTALTAIIVYIGNKAVNVAGILSTLGSFVGITAGLYIIALSLNKLRGFKFEEIKDNLIALGVVAAAAVAIAVLFGVIPSIATGALAAAGILLSVGVTMAAVGVFLWLAAEALDKFVDVLLKIDGKTDTISKSLTGLLTGLVGALGAALKAGLLGISNAINDPEVRNAISGAVTGILTFIRDNIGTWTSLIIEIAAAFAKAIVDAIDLYAIGEWLDEKLLGNKISTSVDIIVETNLNIKKANMLSELYATYSSEMQELSRLMGYSQEQWDAMMAKHGTEVKGMLDYIIEAYNFGNEEFKQRIEEAGGLGTFMRNILLEYYNMEGINPKPSRVDLAREAQIDSFVNSQLKNEKYNTTELKREQLTLTEAAGLLKQAMAKGWDTKEGLSLRALASKEVEDLLLVTKSKSLLAAADNLGVEISDTVRNAVLNNGSTGLLDSTSFKIMSDPETFYKECDDVGKTGVQRMREAALKELEENGPIIGFNPQENVTREQIIWGEQNKFNESSIYSPTPAPYRTSTNRGSKDSNSLTSWVKEQSKDLSYWKELEKWAMEKQNNPFSTLDPGELKNNINTWVNVLKESGLTIRDVENRFGTDAADVYATYFSLSEKAIGKGFISAADMVSSGFSSLGTELSGNGAGTKGLPILAYNKLNATLTKDYFDPLQVGLIAGFSTSGTAGVNQFGQTIGTIDEVLGATRPKVESDMYTTFFSPLISYMAINGGTTGNSYLDALALSMSSTITVRPYITVEPVFNLDTNKEIQKAQASYWQAGSAAQTYYAQNTKSSLDILRDKVAGYIKEALNFGENTESVFRVTGEMVTAGIAYGMQDKESRNMLGVSAKSVSQTIMNKLKQVLGIHSPAEKSQKEIGEPLTAGAAVGMVDQKSLSMLEDSSQEMADFTSNSLETSFANVDLATIGANLGDTLKSRLPSMSDILSNFGFDKGISGNIQGVKNVWNMLKDTLSGGIDVQGWLKDAGFDINAITSGLDMSGVSLEQLGFSVSAGDVFSDFDYENFGSEFATFDVNDLVTNNTIDLDINTDTFDNWMKENTTLDLATSVPVTGGYQQSTVGSTYVNNYNYNQTNNSPTALSSREIRRESEKLLYRRFGSGNFRPV